MHSTKWVRSLNASKRASDNLLQRDSRGCLCGYAQAFLPRFSNLTHALRERGACFPTPLALSLEQPPQGDGHEPALRVTKQRAEPLLRHHRIVMFPE